MAIRLHQRQTDREEAGDEGSDTVHAQLISCYQLMTNS